MALKKIPHETVQRILDAADIVEVVSDFVTLKRRGANYIGLCPFHNERTPSFSVSKSKGICKCFSCGKGGSPVNFIMEIEQVGFYDALRYLARKYGIEIQERELSAEEQQAETVRESMFAVNEFALRHFAKNLTENASGRAIGLAYFRERGINDAMISRFDLGYALDERDDLLNAATKAGYNEKYLIDTGLCSRTEQGRVFDRFRGRVIYPVRTVSGKVVAFGGRVLRSDKQLAKYVNSPESIIYSKRNELYGLYQAKQAINRQDKCILVEGYMDVISMHQAGVENVVASSGTSLTDRQVNLIHRFTENITVIYDSDPAGIKASLRGIDMLLADGLNVKVVLLPDGDDPDSFAQNHSSTEVEQYIASHETDFIVFKTRILMGDAGSDPIARSRAITDILRSISVIPGEIQRTVYIRETARAFEIDEGVLTAQVAKLLAENLAKSREQHQQREEFAAIDEPMREPLPADVAAATRQPLKPDRSDSSCAFLRKYEEQVLHYVLKYGQTILCDAIDEDGGQIPMTVLEYVTNDMAADEITFANADLAAIFARASELVDGEWAAAYDAAAAAIAAAAERTRAEGRERIRSEAAELSSIERMERELEESIAADARRREDDARAAFLAHRMVNDPDDNVRRFATAIVADKYVLSKIHTKYAHVETERDRLAEFVPRALYELKNAILECRIRDVRERIKGAVASNADIEILKPMMEEIIELDRLKTEFAKYLGDRIIAPRHRR